MKTIFRVAIFLFFTICCRIGQAQEEFVEPVLHPPHDTFRTETLWNFTFECAVYNVSSNLSDVSLDVVGGPIYHSNQTIIPRENETDMIDAILVVDAGLREEEGYSYLCRADYTNEGEYVPGDEVMIKNTGTGVRLIPHPAEFNIDDNVTLTCQIDLTRLEEGDKIESISWYYDSELMCNYYQCENCTTGTINITSDFDSKIKDFGVAPDMDNSELKLEITSCDWLTNFTCEIHTVNDATAMDTYEVAFKDGEGYPDPFGEILGPLPPTDKSDWSFTYACYADRTLEVPEMTLNSTGGETVGNITASDYFNETCLYNITYKEELVLKYGNCISFECITTYPGREPQSYRGFAVCYDDSIPTPKPTDNGSNIKAWEVVLIVLGCLVLIVLIIVGIKFYTRKSKGYQDIDKVINKPQ